MDARRRSTLLAFAVLLAPACAPHVEPVVAKEPPPVPIATVENLGFEAEHALNAAELSLNELQVDLALQHLDVAQAKLDDARIRTYPEAKQLRARKEQLELRVPVVRREIEKRALAEKVKAAKEKIDEVLGELRARVKALGDARETSDLDQTLAAVDRVKTALDETSDLEPQDLTFAKQSLALRKELRADRDRVDDRRRALAAEAARQDARRTRSELVDALKATWVRGTTSSQVEAAEKAARTYDEALALARKLAPEDAKLAKSTVEARKWLTTVRTTLAKRKLDVLAREQRTKLHEAYAAVRVGAENARRTDASAADVTHAQAVLKTAKEVLAEGTALERQDHGYATFASAVRRDLGDVGRALDLAGESVTFREGPLAAMIAGLNAEEKAALGVGASREEQRDALTAALTKLRACEKDGEALIEQHPRLAGLPLVLEGKKTSGRAVPATCKAHARTLEAKLGAVEATLAFYEGPARSFEKAQSLLDRAEGTNAPAAAEAAYGAALAELESCVETGRILEYRHPELKREQFQLGGRSVTLPAVVADCHTRAKAIRANLQGRRS